MLIKSSTFNIDDEYYLRHVCAHTIIGKNVECQAQIKRKRDTSFSLVILYLRIKKIVRGILWVSWGASFVYSTDFSKLKASRPDTLFLCHTVQSFVRFTRTKRRRVCKTNECDGNFPLELGTVFFASEKGCLQCVFEDNCRHPLRSRFNSGIIILFNFCRHCTDFF